MKIFHNNERNDPPKSLCTKVEGKPGTGKSFVINTLRNMTRMIQNTNNVDMASAPTGAVSAIINGATHCRSVLIPTGKALKKTQVMCNFLILIK